MSSRVLFSSLICALVGSLWVPEASGIIRRHDVDDSEYVVDAADYPALVDLLGPGDCIATLIAPEWLITAAHCATEMSPNATLTIAGASYAVSATQIPASWNDDTDDIALVQLSTAVPDVTPIPIYRGTDELDQLIWFVGRGDTATGLEGQASAKVDGLTRKASNRITDVDAWWLMFVFHSPDDAAVTDLEGISGDGDSGGPALLETAEGTWVVGVSSFQDEGGHALGTYGVEEFYTRVSQYADWIDGFVPAAQPPAEPVAPATDGGPSEADVDPGSTEDAVGPEERASSAELAESESPAPAADDDGCGAASGSAPWQTPLGWAALCALWWVSRGRAWGVTSSVR